MFSLLFSDSFRGEYLGFMARCVIRGFITALTTDCTMYMFYYRAYFGGARGVLDRGFSLPLYTHSCFFFYLLECGCPNDGTQITQAACFKFVTQITESIFFHTYIYPTTPRFVRSHVVVLFAVRVAFYQLDFLSMS